MRAYDEDLLRIFTAANLTDHVSAFHRPIRERVLNIESRAGDYSRIHIPLQLALVFRGHGHDRNRKVGVEAENPGLSDLAVASEDKHDIARAEVNYTVVADLAA